MSQENVEKLRRVYQAFERRDFETAVQYLHADVELYPALEGPDFFDRPIRGHDGMKQFWETIYEPWVSQAIEPRELIEAPGDRILAVERWHVRGRGHRRLRLSRRPHIPNRWLH